MITAVELTSTADAAAALDHANQQAIAAELAMAVSIAALCDLHRVDEDAWFDGMERWVNGGSDGTPKIGEFIAAEIAGLLGCSIGSAFSRIHTVLNLRHRHPRLWTGFLAGEMRYWEVSRVAEEARIAELDADACARLDRMCEVALRLQPWQRVWPQISKWIIMADPALAADRARRATERRHVAIGRIDDGITEVHGRLDAADGIALDDALDHLSDLVDGDCQDHRRATALGVLARMAFGQDALPDAPPHDSAPGCLPDGGVPDRLPHGGVPSEVGLGELQRTGSQPATHQHGSAVVFEPASDAHPRPPVSTGGTGGTGGTGQVSRTAELVVGIDAADLIDPSTGVVSIDRWGHLLLPRLTDLLAGCQVTIRPIVAGSELEPTAAYQVPGRMRAAVELRNPVDVFPYGVKNSRHCQLDHTEPFEHGRRRGPGQTRPGNLGPLSTFTHRVKTHGGWHLTQPEPGTFHWRSPLGYEYLVTPGGTVLIKRPARRSRVPATGTDEDEAARPDFH